VQDYEYLNVLTNAGQGSYVQTQITSWITTLTPLNQRAASKLRGWLLAGDASTDLSYLLTASY